jgi:hypothetical protein
MVNGDGQPDRGGGHAEQTNLIRGFVRENPGTKTKLTIPQRKDA